MRTRNDFATWEYLAMGAGIVGGIVGLVWVVLTQLGGQF